MNKQKELSNLDRSQEKFQSAYSIKGKGVAKLDLDRALKSDDFRNATRKLVEQIQKLDDKKASR